MGGSRCVRRGTRREARVGRRERLLDCWCKSRRPSFAIILIFRSIMVWSSGCGDMWPSPNEWVVRSGSVFEGRARAWRRLPTPARGLGCVWYARCCPIRRVWLVNPAEGALATRVRPSRRRACVDCGSCSGEANSSSALPGEKFYICKEVYKV